MSIPEKIGHWVGGAIVVAFGATFGIVCCAVVVAAWRWALR